MTTIRLIVVLLVVGVVLLLGLQNLATSLPLVFFGGSTQALPLGLWLVGAIALGALTTLVLTALLGSAGGTPGGRSKAYKYRPEAFYEPSAGSSGAANAASQDFRNPPPYNAPGPRQPRSQRSPVASDGDPGDDPAAADPNWRAWNSLRSPGQWNDWESLSQAPKPETAPATSSAGAAGIIDGVTTWFSSSKRQAKQQQQVNESLRALDDNWDGLENRPYTAPGASPVQDSLDDINQGWDQDSHRDLESGQPPRRVYRDGSLYSYSYRDGQADNIYAPPDDTLYGDHDSGAGYGPAAGDRAEFDEGGDDTPLGDPEIADDGVVDADYRVIVPPYTAAADAVPPEGRDDGAGDDWDDADDALTP
ncbi:hypothetical protein IQ254_22335 [Nodosilinea sp. LEGE 07088]|uniref:hypothetical protein n=1 Tax=Nodosilinea sp. LEGE 07088 TaxID=2777968 RepID=UPI0018816183|nr:hypothetical protein [Nodosilinea sp. LEGE 07088]MBE9139900.1 hypothetical protein [Nodosilinea sp. LEGE 07088]